jgi:hypothetical protein
MGFWYFDWTIFLLIPAFILAMVAQTKVKSAYNRYLRVPVRNGMTGAQTARRILDANGLTDVPVGVVQGELSDHYDPTKRSVSLSPDVYNQPTVASVAIAAHECGHALQHQQGYSLLMIRNTIAKPVSFISMASWPLLIIGILMINAGKLTQGNMIFDIGVFAFAAVVLFHLVTLPVELNASSRALAQLEKEGIVAAEEKAGAKKVLSAAALTYVAALAMAVAQLLRLLLIRGRN